MIHIDFVEVLLAEYLGKQTSEEKLKLFFVFITSGKDKERFLFYCDFGFIVVEALKVIDF